VTDQRFAVCTFDRVFDTAPKRETLLLRDLVRGLLRFELKPELLQRVDKNLRKLDQVWASWEAGTYRSGKQYAALKAAADEARRDGQDPDAAARTTWEHLVTDAKGAPKRDLRLWAPCHYPANAKRGGDEVIHLSCLVLDYDKGLAFEEAQAVWMDWFHLAHSTWSHTPETPKFRIVLPLAGPVAASEWRGVWEWAATLTGPWIDPAMKGRGVTFALPTSPSAEAPKIAALHDGAPLLDPVALGLIAACASPPPVISDIDRPVSHFNGGVAGHRYQELGPLDLLTQPPDTLDVSGEWDVAPQGDGADGGHDRGPARDPIDVDDTVYGDSGEWDAVPMGAAPAPPPALEQSEPRSTPAPPPRDTEPEPSPTPSPIESETEWDERSDEWETLFDDL